VLLRSAVEVGASIDSYRRRKDKLAPYEKLFYENLSKMLEKTVLRR
jgi:hypothetical protein